MEKSNYLKDNKELMEEYDYDKNTEFNLDKLTLGSDKKVWWRCSKDHSWQATIGSRNRGSGCPYCAGNIKKTNSEFVLELESINPNLTPMDQYCGWDNKIRFKCEICGEVWQARPGKVLKGSGCPNCGNKYQTSFPEQAIFYYVKKEFPDTISRYKHNNYEIDIFIPELNIGIEYDGYKWHKSNLKNDNKKDMVCKEEKIQLIRIREAGLFETVNAINIFRKNNSSLKDLEDSIKLIFMTIEKNNVYIDLEADRLKILEMFKSIIKDNQMNNSLLINEWNYDRNGVLKPEYFSNGSSEKVWWKCSKCGHEWQACISDRNNGNGCPACYGRVPIKGKNDLETINPLLSSEWDKEKNENEVPSDFLPNSTKKVWWKCSKCGHEWQASIGNRSKGTGCPACYGRVPIKGKNDLETINPLLSSEWNQEKNENKVPSDFLPNSNKKVWWKCSKCGHEWQAVIANRSKGSGCPNCLKTKK